MRDAKDKREDVSVLQILKDEARLIEAAGGSDCGQRPNGGAVQHCRCAHCVSFRRMQLRIKALNRRRGVANSELLDPRPLLGSVRYRHLNARQRATAERAREHHLQMLIVVHYDDEPSDE